MPRKKAAPESEVAEEDPFAAPEGMVKVRWTHGNRGNVGGVTRYRDDIFECDAEEAELNPYIEVLE